ncbi:hypothetical protein F0M18_15800 [Pseudohalioglobus sediminis]|uniref:Uncharacterized protein n=1 Tax=Pseudohalioglobus sediminis TaxID=2606449 RepID=A0A5B0WTD7_9GAMM|nr:hypothetical protein [Pseudohalioglobus sediminis]KAA1189139.1 hypothetical protein F0M18_15800 [Pseudohalioglobus sediminis]
MRRPVAFCALIAASLGWHSTAQAFRNCDPSQDSTGFRGSSRYYIGELQFDAATGDTIGTETHYNYSNPGDDDIVECHVTYAITGVFDAAGQLFLLDAERSGFSRGCDSEFIAVNYPELTSYTLQVSRAEDDTVEVVRADSGEAVGEGNWHDGSVSYKTQETCELY